MTRRVILLLILILSLLNSIFAIPIITLNSPSNNNNSVSLLDQTIFDCSINDSVNLKNVTLYTDLDGSWQAIETKSISGTSATKTFTLNPRELIGTDRIKDSTFLWNCLAYNINNEYAFAGSNNSFSGWDLGLYDKTMITSTDISLTTNHSLKELPNNGASDGWVDMTDNVLLMHLNRNTDYSETDLYAYDFSGQGHHGTIDGLTYNSNGKLNGNYYFDDNYHEIVCGTSGWPTSLPVTLMAWVYFPADSNNYDYMMHMSAWGSGTDMWIMARYRYSNKFFYWGDGGAKYGPVIPTGKWTHLAINFRESVPYAVLYMNGKEVSVEQTSSTVISEGVSCLIGANNPAVVGSANSMDGYMDEVAMWSRSLSATEIYNIYNRQKGNFIDEGEYTSNIFSLPTNVSWSNMTLDIEHEYYGEELPDNGVTETGLSGMDMTGNKLLFHFNNDGAYGESSSLANDFSGNNDDGVISGASPSIFGKLNGSMYFSRSSTDRVYITDSNTFGITNQMTISAWVLPTALDDDWSRIIGKAWNSVSDPWSVFTLQVDNSQPRKPCMAITTNSVDNTVCAGTTRLELGKWTFLTGTYDGSNMRIYVNGVLEGTVAKTGNLPTNSQPLDIGRNTINSGQDFAGYIDEVSLWSRVLSADEIYDMYTRTAGDLDVLVRSCDNNSCSGESWINLGTAKSYYNISSLENNFYFQYKLIYGGDGIITPELKTSTVIISHSDASTPEPATTSNIRKSIFPSNSFLSLLIGLFIILIGMFIN